jgi:hypothetical protein
MNLTRASTTASLCPPPPPRPRSPPSALALRHQRPPVPCSPIIFLPTPGNSILATHPAMPTHTPSPSYAPPPKPSALNPRRRGFAAVMPRNPWRQLMLPPILCCCCGGQISPGSTRRLEDLTKGLGPIVSQGHPFVGLGRNV